MFCFRGSITLLPTMSNPSRSLQLTLPSPVPMGLTSVFSEFPVQQWREKVVVWGVKAAVPAWVAPEWDAGEQQLLHSGEDPGL